MSIIFCHNTYIGLINIFIVIIYPARIQNPFRMFRKRRYLRHNFKTKEPNTCMRSPYPARMTFFYLILPFDARTYDFPLCGIFVLAHEQYGIFYTSGDGSAFAPVVRPPTTSVPPHWPTQHHLATAAQ